MAQAQIIQAQAKSKFEEEMWKLADEAMKKPKPKKKKSENISMENKVKKEQKEEELIFVGEKETKKGKGIFKYIIVGYAIFSFDYIRGI